MRLVDPLGLTLFPPARWSGATPAVEITALVDGTAARLHDSDCDLLESDLRRMIARRVPRPKLAIPSWS